MFMLLTRLNSPQSCVVTLFLKMSFLMLFEIITLPPRNSTLVCLKIRSASFQLLVGHYCTMLLYLQAYARVCVNNLHDTLFYGSGCFTVRFEVLCRYSSQENVKFRALSIRRKGRTESGIFRLLKMC
jgi:hypothetical protein